MKALLIIVVVMVISISCTTENNETNKNTSLTNIVEDNKINNTQEEEDTTNEIVLTVTPTAIPTMTPTLVSVINEKLIPSNIKDTCLKDLQYESTIAFACVLYDFTVVYVYATSNDEITILDNKCLEAVLTKDELNSLKGFGTNNIDIHSKLKMPIKCAKTYNTDNI